MRRVELKIWLSSALRCTVNCRRYYELYKRSKCTKTNFRDGRRARKIVYMLNAHITQQAKTREEKFSQLEEGCTQMFHILSCSIFSCARRENDLLKIWAHRKDDVWLAVLKLMYPSMLLFSTLLLLHPSNFLMEGCSARMNCVHFAVCSFCKCTLGTFSHLQHPLECC
ncbi:unnamed protein product [Orchesella dallaii]|uniref:Uncharacterized protein n=1 Tax=Orchesella dallaii TaxID=48710 RepID=A0ABP1QNE1_9HEXA